MIFECVASWYYVLTVACCSRCVHMFATGDGLLTQTDETTDDGLKQIFATNLFGHFILVSLHHDCLLLLQDCSKKAV